MDSITQPIASTLGVDESIAALIIYGFVSLILLLILLIVLLKKKSVKKDRVLFLGLSDAGKTHLFLNLVTGPRNNSGRATTTYTSTQENVYEGVKLEPSAPAITLVDVPGAEKLRAQGMGKYMAGSSINSVKAIVFVVDAATFVKASKDVAELLYQVLLYRRRDSPPLAILAHKQDLSTAKTPSVIQSTLSKEFVLLEKSRSAALDSTEGDDGKGLLGAVNWNRLLFIPTSGVPNEEASLRPLREWLLSL